MGCHIYTIWPYCEDSVNTPRYFLSVYWPCNTGNPHSTRQTALPDQQVISSNNKVVLF